MINISEEEQARYNDDVGNKRIRLEFYEYYDDIPNGGNNPDYLFFNDHIIAESMELNEAITSETNIRYGQCYSSRFSIEIFNMSDICISDVDLLNWGVKAYVYISDDPREYQKYETQTEQRYIPPMPPNAVPLFSGIIKNVELKDNRNTKRITAYDILSEALNTDVTNLFWNDLTKGRTVRYIRNKILETIDVKQEEVLLINDNIILSGFKTDSNVKVTARQALESILEFTGCFGHIDRDGIFRYKYLKYVGYNYPAKSYDEKVLYPNSKLYPGLVENPDKKESPKKYVQQIYPARASSLFVHYPSNTIYPGLNEYEELDLISTKDIKTHYIKLRYSEYSVEDISGVEFVSSENAIIDRYIDREKQAAGNTHIYVSKSNLFITQKINDGQTHNDFSQNVYVEINNNIFRPYRLEIAGMPYMEVGDYVVVMPANEDAGTSSLTVPIFSRTLKGIGSLKDTYEAKGIESRKKKVRSV